MHYCGIVPAQSFVQLAMLAELRTDEPPIRLQATFFEPASAAQVAAELLALGEVVVAIGAPPDPEGAGKRACDSTLRRLGIPPASAHPETVAVWEALAGLVRFDGDGEEPDGAVPEGAFHEMPLLETNADAAFCALQARRVPSKRHPLGMQMRIEELEQDQVLDDGGELWHRRIEEIDAAGAALCAHRYAVGHACYLGVPDEGVLVLPGAAVPEQFPTQGVLPPVERVQLPEQS